MDPSSQVAARNARKGYNLGGAQGIFLGGITGSIGIK